jgi:hypothetical protein
MILKDETLIEAPPERIFEFFAHMEENYAAWHPDHVAFRWTKGKGLEPGYHREISERLEAHALAGGSESGPFNPYGFMDERGIFREILTYDSWEYLRQSDVRLGLETRLAVNRVFRQQEYVENAVRAAVGFLSERELFDPARSDENQVIFHRLITDLYYQQVALLETYGRFLETHRD